MQSRFYKTRRDHLLARIRVLRDEVDHGRHESFRVQSRKILQRLCGELDDLDALKRETA